jgi:hypothetical protein
MRFGLIIVFICCHYFVFGQTCEKVLFTGKVVDTLRPQSFYNLMIINRTTGRGVFGQPNGTFSVYVEDGDSVSLSVKDYPVVHLVVKADADCQFRKRIYIEMKAQDIQEIVVKPLKSLEQIKEEREALAMRETRMVTGIEVMQSPITALYQAFSKVERNKRWIAEQQYRDNQRQIVKELLRLYVAYDVIELSEEEFDSFIEFLNINEDFLKTATEMELITFIQDKFDHFSVMKKMRNTSNPEWRTILHTDEKRALSVLLDFYVSHKVIELPSTEYDRFIRFLNQEKTMLLKMTDAEVINLVRTKYEDYLVFYKIDSRLLKENFNLSDEDNEDWRWNLKRHPDIKIAIKSLLNLYNEHKVIQLNPDEFDKFIIFLNLKEPFMKTATNEEMIRFVRTKYYEYLDFYKK